MPLSKIEDPNERSTNKWFDARIPYFLIKEVLAQYIHEPVDKFPQTNKPKEKKR